MQVSGHVVIMLGTQGVPKTSRYPLGPAQKAVYTGGEIAVFADLPLVHITLGFEGMWGRAGRGRGFQQEVFGSIGRHAVFPLPETIHLQAWCHG
jgi:hypothetical protein